MGERYEEPQASNPDVGAARIYPHGDQHNCSAFNKRSLGGQVSIEVADYTNDGKFA